MNLAKRHAPILTVAKRDGGIIRESGLFGWTYWTKDGKSLPRRSVDELITAGLLKGDDDGLLEGASQVFRFHLGEAA